MKNQRVTTSTDRAGSPASGQVSRSVRVERAVERCIAEKNYGDIVTREELEAWFAIKYPTEGSRDEFDRLNVLFTSLKADFDKRLLTEHKMALESQGGGNWRILLPREQGDFGLKRAGDLANKALEKGMSIVENTKVSMLNDAERARLADQSGRLAAINALMTRRFASSGRARAKD